MRKVKIRKGAISHLTHRITVPVLVILYILTVIAGIASLAIIENHNRSEQYKQVSEELFKTQVGVDVYLEEMVRTASNLRIDQDVELFFKYPDLTDAQKGKIALTIKSAINMVPSIYTIYLMSNKSDSFMYFGKNSNKMLNKDAFYDRSVFDFLKSGLISARAVYARKVYDAAANRQLDLITVFGYNGYSDSNGPLTAVVVNMKTSVLQKAIAAGYSSGKAPMLIGRDGMVLTQGGVFKQYSMLSDNGIDIVSQRANQHLQKYSFNDISYYIISTPIDLFGTSIIHMIPVSEFDASLLPGRITAILILSAAIFTVTILWIILNQYAKKPISEMVQRTNKLERDLIKDEKSQMMQVIRSIMQHGRMYSREKRKEMVKNVSLPFDADENVFLMEILIHNYLGLISEKSGKEYEALIYGAGNIIEEIMSADSKCIVANRVANGSFYIIGTPNNGAWERLPDIISNSIDSMNAILADALGIRAIILYSTKKVPLHDIYLLAEKTERAAANRPFYTAGTVIDVENYIIPDYTELYRSVFGRVNEYIVAMQAEDFERADGLLTAVFDVSDIFEMRFAWSVMTLTALPMICSAYSQEINQEITDMLNDEQTLSKLSNGNEMIAWVTECHKKLCDNIRSHKLDKNYNLVNKVNAIINRSYSDPELNVAYIANIIGVSPNYLSSMYRKLTSTKLTEHIQEVRLSIAREKLTETDMLVSDIARACGYAYNVGYFQQLFKRKHGLTPSQYREKHAVKEQSAM